MKSGILNSMNDSEILTLKSEADTIMAIPGNTNGSTFQTDSEFVVFKEGKEGLKKLEETLGILGYPFSYANVKSYQWYPEAQAVLGIYVAEKIFSWTEKDLFDMGYSAPALSFIIRILVRFTSLEKTFSQAPMLWTKYYDFGAFETKELDTVNKFLTFTITGYGFFIYMEKYFDGFFTKMLQLVGITSNESLESHWLNEEDHSSRTYRVHWS